MAVIIRGNNRNSDSTCLTFILRYDNTHFSDK